MTELVGEAVVRIRTDDSQVNKGIETAGKKGGESYSKGFTGALKGLAGAAGLAFGADKAVDFLKSGIETATSFQDEVGALGVIIGKQGTDKILEFGETSAKAFGISKTAALEASHTFATFGKSAGLSGTDLADFSTQFASLAGDLASFNGGSTEDAITAIGSALRGEAEPIRRYGVLLDDASLRQAALRLGIIKNIKDALTPQQKVLAAQAEIFRQTKDAQGDFARTSDSAANSQKRLTAQLADLRLEVGQKILPLFTKAVQGVGEFVTQMDEGTGAGGQFVDILKDTAAVGKTILDFFNGLPGPVKKYGAELLIAAFALSKVSSGVTGLIGQFSTMKVSQDGIARSSFALGQGLKSLAGAGGLVLLTQGLKEADDSASAFKTTLGAAAVGFSIAGPIGGAVGAFAGFAASVVKANSETTASFDTSKAAADAYATSIDNVTGELKDNTDAAVINALQKSNPRVIQAANAIGINNRLLVRALEGHPASLAKLNAALREGEISGKLFTDSLGGQATASVVLQQALFGVKGSTDENIKGQEGLLAAFKRTAKQEQEAADRTRGLTEALKGVPTSVVTDFSNPDLPRTLGDVENLIDTYKRTPKQVETLVKTLGFDLTDREMRILINRSIDLDKRNPSINVTADTSQARASLNGLNKLLRDVVRGFGNIDIPGDGIGRSQSGQSDWRGGLTQVGEAGREIVWLPRHAQVMSNPRSEQFLSRSGGGGVSAKALGDAVALALIASGAAGPTIMNPVPETATVSQRRRLENATFLLGAS